MNDSAAAPNSAEARAARCASPPLLAPGEDSPGHVSETEVQAWLPLCRALPKAELHAHINGCVRDATILCAPGAGAWREWLRGARVSGCVQLAACRVRHCVQGC